MFQIKPRAENNESGRPWYDTQQGIEKCLTSLKALHELVDERYMAGYSRGESLNQFVIFGGRYSLDTCGNCSKVQGPALKDVDCKTPKVMAMSEFLQRLTTQGAKGASAMFEMNGGELPLPGLKCPFCHKTWDIGNCHDTVVWHKTTDISLKSFVGKTLGDVKESFGKRRDAVYRMQGDILIHNDRFIDRSPQYPNPTEEWQKSILKNENGWVGEKNGITDQYVIQTDDKGFFNVWRYFHSACNTAEREKTLGQQFLKIFVKAGFKKISLVGIRNEYCQCNRCGPWFKVGTNFGTIKIGLRKRVINIDWKGLRLGKIKLNDLFSKEDVTRGEDYIHAWSWNKAQEYLSLIYSRLTSKNK